MALDLDWIENSPLTRVRVPENAKQRKKKEPISQEEFSRLIKKVGEDSDYYVPIMIGWYTGMRLGEILALTWNDIDLSNGIIHVRKQVIDN